MPNLSRRHLVTTAAALPALAGPAIALAAIPAPTIAIPNPIDAQLIELGSQFEALLVQFFDCWFEWAPLMRAAHAAVEEKYGAQGWGLNKAANRFFSRTLSKNGCGKVADRMDALGDEMYSLADEIKETPAFHIGSLRAKALVMLWEARSPMASHDGELSFANDGGASEALFKAVAELTGLMPIVEGIRKKLAADVEAVQS
jgi:hypothetical protein